MSDGLPDPLSTVSPLPAWIEDEDRLRDEGVVFGLGGREKAAEAKVEAIRRVFDQRRAQVARCQETLTRALENARARRDAVQDEIERQRARIASPDEPSIEGGDAADVAPHYFLRYLVGLLLAFGLCSLNYILIYELVAPAFEQPWFVAAGVLTAGMFALFQPSSLLYNNDDDQGLFQDAPAELWKQRVSEFGVPLAAALFATVWRVSSMAWYESAVSFLFVFMLFLFGGKLFLSMIPQLSIVTRNVLRNRRVRRDRQRRRKVIRSLRQDDVPAALERIDRIDRTLNQLPTSEELGSQCERSIAIFSSEVALAAAARDHPDLSGRRLHAIR